MKPDINLDALREVLGTTAVIRALERELVKPQVNVAAVWRYFTTSVYTSGDLVVIATREALQNSLDAVRAAQHKGLLKKGEGRFEVSWDDAVGALSWQDNGIGMDRETVRNKFLSLGDSGKRDVADSQQAAGGFGVAKAVILGLSERFEWTLHTRDVLATSGQGTDIELGSATERRGTQITVYSLSKRLLSAYSPLSGEYQPIPDRVRQMLSVCDLPELELRLDGARVEPAFSRRGGSLIADGAGWGPGTTARVRGFKRQDRRGAFWVRLGGLYQFARPSNAKLPADIVVDLMTTQRPGDVDYPLTASRDQLQGEARQALEDLVERVEQENASAGRSQEYEVLLPEGDSPVAADTEAALAAPELQAALREAGLALREGLRAHAEMQRTIEAPASQAPGRAPRPEREPEDLRGPLSAAEELAGAGTPDTQALAEQLAPDDAGAQSFYAEALERAKRGQASEEDLRLLHRATGQLVERAAEPGGGGLLAVAAAQRALSGLPGAARVALSPFGAMAGLRVSKKNFDPRRAAAFKRGYAKWVPYLVLWDATLRLVAAQGRIRRAFRPGFVLDDSVNGLAAIERPSGAGGRTVAVIYVHPFTLEAQAKAHRSRPLMVAYWLHAIACHELTHLDGRMNEYHSEQYVAAREALGHETAMLLHPISDLAINLLGLEDRRESPKELEQRAWTLVAAAQREIGARSGAASQVAGWFRRNRPLVQLVVRAVANLRSPGAS